MRNISVQLTQSQIRAGTKHVTRRLGWANAQPGELLMTCPKCQGLGPGGIMQRIHPIRITSNRPEPLSTLIDNPAYGFPDLDGPGFVAMFCRAMKVAPSQIVNRLAFDPVFPHDWIAATLAAHTFDFHAAGNLPAQIASAFLAAAIPFQRDVPLGSSSVDFLVLGHVAVEVRTGGAATAATRQSVGYLEDPRASQAVIISANPIDLPAADYLTRDGSTKPLHLLEFPKYPQAR